MNTSSADARYCAAQVRRFDHDRYLCTLFAPPERRRALLALLAFNLEVARVREMVSEPLLGEMRLEWWREALDGLYRGAPPAHQVVLELASVHRATALNRRHFERQLEARRLDLKDAPPASLVALEDYAEATSAGLLHLALEALGAGDGAARAAARGVGIAWALIGLVRALPFHAAQGRLYLPADLLEAAGIGADDVLRRRRPEAVNLVVSRILDRARHHLEAARALGPQVPAEALPPLLPAILADLYLARLARSDGDPYAVTSTIAAPRRLLALWRAARSARY